MFEATAMLFIYVETPLHAGTARGLGAVDLPIQRERTTDYPIVQASSLKGRLRAEARSSLENAELQAIFGPETINASAHAGALSAGDARILLFPVRSLAGVFAWTTSIHALARFQREAALANLNLHWSLPAEPARDEALVAGDTALKAGESIVLEEFSFTPRQQQAAKDIASWLATYAFPQGNEYAYWREALARKLCILPEDAFRDFVRYSTEIQTHVQLDQETKTVSARALWTSESLPADTLLYAPLMATQSRNGANLPGSQILQKVIGLGLERTQLGGDETTGQGMVAFRFHNGPSAGAGGAA
jgi:CRISPR-associated protein Cmr4